ncbi:unnamed protein product [Euphydryas editha]|uniref:C2H2-type domain-containing protein n=1 Tax=Euphydryas editha TaxID=104508 RepID=A0AAU9UNE5_EUPED|nr:unnamed protein product [Euphydryas editha]
MTIPERNNAAIFLLCTTVRPFTFMGSSFKCFFCMQYHSEIGNLLEHTSSHEIGDETLVLEKYIPKGKRTLQVDISKLKCRLCDQLYPNLDTIRNHLKTEHKKEFSPAGNGMTEYNMEAKNGSFVCHVCDKKFHSFPLFNSHMNCHVGKVVCENCGAGFLNQHHLMKHKESHMTKKFSCKKCDRVFLKNSQLKYHDEIIHKGKDRVKPKKCQHCSQTFKEHYSKMIHLKDVHGITKSFSCHVCKINLSTRRALTEHTTRYHTEKYKCEVCSKCFSIESKLKQHMRGHTEITLLLPQPDFKRFIITKFKERQAKTKSFEPEMQYAAECNQPFSSLKEIKKHLENIHNIGFTDADNGMIAFNLEMINDLFTCHISSKSFERFFLLNMHISVHYLQ